MLVWEFFGKVINIVEIFKVPEIYSVIGVVGVGIGIAGALVGIFIALNAFLRSRGSDDPEDPKKKVEGIPLDVDRVKQTLSDALDQKEIIKDFLNKVGACSMYIASVSIGVLVSSVKTMIDSPVFDIIYKKIMDGSLAGITDVQREAVLFFNVVRELPAVEVEGYLLNNIAMVKVHLLNLVGVGHVYMAGFQLIINDCEASLQKAMVETVQTVSSFIKDNPVTSTPNYGVYGVYGAIAIGIGVVGYIAYKFFF